MPPSSPSRPARSGVRPDYQRLARDLRDQIMRGALAPGSRLPSTRELAASWRSSPYTVHIALAALAREGWIERIHGAGTFVAHPESRFARAAIYHESDLAAPGNTDFARSIDSGLRECLSGLGKEVEVFVDARPAGQRNKLLPALADALLGRSVQCVIAPTATFRNSPALKGLTVPVAYAGNPGSPCRVDFDKVEFLREGVRTLKRQGCRSVGLISPYPRRATGDGIPHLWPSLQRIALEEGIALHREWGNDPEVYPPVDCEGTGYRELRRIWKLKKRPDGLLVFPDTFVRGVIVAALEIGVREVGATMKFVLHRNAHVDVLCPFPVTWGISDENLLARHLVQIVEKQFRGEPVTPTLLPYEMKADDGSRWK